MKIISAFILSLFLFNCVDNSIDSRSIQNNKYTNSAIGLSLQFPSNWQLKLDQKYGTVNVDLVALGPASQNFSPNVNIIIEPHTGSAVIDWRSTLDSEKVQLQSQILDLGNYSDTILTLDGNTYGEMSYTTTSQGYPLKIKQALILNKNQEITITYTDLSSRFDQNLDFPSIEASMDIY